MKCRTYDQQRLLRPAFKKETSDYNNYRVIKSAEHCLQSVCENINSPLEYYESLRNNAVLERDVPAKTVYV
jgi:hypothetical protein